MAEEDYIQKLADAQAARQKKLAPIAPKTGPMNTTGPIARTSEVKKPGQNLDGFKKKASALAVGAIGGAVSAAAKRLLQNKKQPLKNPVVE